VEISWAVKLLYSLITHLQYAAFGLFICSNIVTFNLWIMYFKIYAKVISTRLTKCKTNNFTSDSVPCVDILWFMRVASLGIGPRRSRSHEWQAEQLSTSLITGISGIYLCIHQTSMTGDESTHFKPSFSDRKEISGSWFSLIMWRCEDVTTVY